MVVIVVARIVKNMSSATLFVAHYAHKVERRLDKKCLSIRKIVVSKNLAALAENCLNATATSTEGKIKRRRWWWLLQSR